MYRQTWNGTFTSSSDVLLLQQKQNHERQNTFKAFITPTY